MIRKGVGSDKSGWPASLREPWNKKLLQQLSLHNLDEIKLQKIEITEKEPERSVRVSNGEVDGTWWRVS